MGQQLYAIYLFLDKTRGHGTDKAVERYCTMLAEEYHVICYHQRPHSPAMNMLDLGIWMAMQNVVQKLHTKSRTEVQALALAVERGLRKLKL